MTNHECADTSFIVSEQRSIKDERRLQTFLAKSPLKMYCSDGTTTKKLKCQGGVSNPAASILEAFLCGFVDKQRQTIFESVDNQGLIHLLQAAQRITENPQLSRRIVLRTVFGASEQMSISSLQYLLPSVYLLEALKNVNPLIEPQVQYVFMNEAGVGMNNMDRGRMADETNLFVNLAQRYLATFHPEVLNDVCFLSDAEFTPRVMGTGLYQGLIEKLKALLPVEAQEDLLKKAVNHGSSADMAYQYAALHPLVHDGLFSGIPFSYLAGAEPINSPDSVDLLISVGAQPETAFYQIRSLLKPSLELGIDGFSPIPAVQYFAAITVPPYGYYGEGDFSLRQALGEPGRLNEVGKRDSNGKSSYYPSVQQAATRLSSDTGELFSLINFFQEMGQ